SLIKKRIVMLQKSKSKQIHLLKYALLLPIVVGMLIYTSCDNDNREGEVIEVTEEQSSPRGNEQKTASEKDLVEIQDGVEVPFAVVENVPVFPGCEDLTSNDEQRKCLSDNINKVVAQNFNKDLAGNLGLTGVIRTTVLFKINTEGNIEGVRARSPHPAMAEEAARVVKLFPKMIPGEQRGKKVTVLYALPIIFQVVDKKTIVDGVHKVE